MGARSFYATLLLLAVTQGASYPFIRVAVRELSPAALMELRIILGLPILLGYCMLLGRWRQLRAAWQVGVGVGLCGVAIPYLLIGWGSIHVDSGVVAIANAAVPIFVVLLALRLLPDESVRGRRLLGVLVGLLGVATLSGFDPHGGWWALAGTLAVVVAAPSYALSFLLTQRRLDLDGVVIATAAMIAAAVVLLPVAIATAPSRVPSATALASLVALGVLSTGLATTLFYRMLTRFGSARASLLTYVTPVFTLAFGAWFLGEPVTAAKVAGLVLICTGVALGAATRRGMPRSGVSGAPG